MNYDDFIRKQKKNVTIIGISAFKGSGKDTVASRLQEILISKGSDVYILSMADPIRDFINSFLGIAEPQYNEKDKLFKQYKYENTTDPDYFKSTISFWAKRLKFKTYRELVNMIGMGMRKQFTDTIWIDICESHIKTIVDMCNKENYWRAQNSLTGPKKIYIIIPDIRYAKEIKFLKRLKNNIGYNVQHWCILRKSALPEWTQYGLDVRIPEHVKIIERDFKPSIHEFEWCKANPKFNKVITNDGTLTDLQNQLITITKNW